MTQHDDHEPAERHEAGTTNRNQIIELDIEYLSEVSGGINPQPLPPRHDFD